MDEIAGALAANQAGLAQGLQLFGGVGLAGAESGRDFSDSAGAVLEEMEDAEACGIAEEAKPFGGEVDLLANGAGRVFGQRSPPRRPRQ